MVRGKWTRSRSSPNPVLLRLVNMVQLLLVFFPVTNSSGNSSAAFDLVLPRLHTTRQGLSSAHTSPVVQEEELAVLETRINDGRVSLADQYLL